MSVRLVQSLEGGCYLRSMSACLVQYAFLTPHNEVIHLEDIVNSTKLVFYEECNQ